MRVYISPPRPKKYFSTKCRKKKWYYFIQYLRAFSVKLETQFGGGGARFFIRMEQLRITEKMLTVVRRIEKGGRFL